MRLLLTSSALLAYASPCVQIVLQKSASQGRRKVDQCSWKNVTFFERFTLVSLTHRLI